MHVRSLHCSAILATFALGGLLAGCGAHSHEAPHGSSGSVDAATPAEPAAPSDGELDAKAKASINDANAEAEFEKLKQEIEGGG